MNLIERVKNIITTPKTEWNVINGEEATPMSLLKSYVIPLLLIGTIAGFLGYAVMGGINLFGIKMSGINWGLYTAASYFTGGIVGYFISTYVIDALAPTFKSEKNINKSAQLVAYSSTAYWVAMAATVLPSLGMLAILGLYSIYLFYIGMGTMKKTPEDQKIIYMIVSAVVMIVVSMIASYIIQSILRPLMGIQMPVYNMMNP
jgi:hypothetical protein